ncbi:MAG: GatB/YqeY domain-containing protein [Candidatus Kerfeldbacteria bacterium]|nr:GatB/YqeY domain-containing protein [Candidatus Kerfeldbacteria bacterium]
MTLKERFEEDYKTAFKAGQREVVGVLRELKAAVKNAEIARRKDFDDNEVLDVIMGQAKQHEDSIRQFTAGRRDDLANMERAQLKVVEQYLPAKLSPDELRDIVGELITQAGATGPKDMGAVMKLVMQKVRGQADGALVKNIVTDELAKRSA